MLNPYFLMTILFMSLAALTALDNSLASFNLISSFGGMRWLRVHFITLGTLTEAAFWLMPALAAARQGQPPPQTRWGTWLALNAGIVTLLIGIPLVNSTLILAGGTLVFIAVMMLIKQLADMGARPVDAGSGQGRPFYIAGLGYFLLGIIVGTGLWLGWGAWLRIQVPIEVHIHATAGASCLSSSPLSSTPTRASRPALARPARLRHLLAAGLWRAGAGAGPWVCSTVLRARPAPAHRRHFPLATVAADNRRWPVASHLTTSYLVLRPGARGAVPLSPACPVSGRASSRTRRRPSSTAGCCSSATPSCPTSSRASSCHASSPAWAAAGSARRHARRRFRLLE